MLGDLSIQLSLHIESLQASVVQHLNDQNDELQERIKKALEVELKEVDLDRYIEEEVNKTLRHSVRSKVIRIVEDRIRTMDIESTVQKALKDIGV